MALVGSPRRQGNTVFAVSVATKELERRGLSCETVMLCDLPISLYDVDTDQQTRVSAEEDVEALLDRVWAADGLILATPIYFCNVSAQMKAFMDRSGRVSSANGGFFTRKAGAAITAVRRGGAAHSLDSMNHWLHIQQTYLVGSSYWNMVYCREIGEAAKDEEGIKTMKILGQNMAYLLERLKK